MQDMKMTDRFARYENARHKSAGHSFSCPVISAVILYTALITLFSTAEKWKLKFYRAVSEWLFLTTCNAMLLADWPELLRVSHHHTVLNHRGCLVFPVLSTSDLRVRSICHQRAAEDDHCWVNWSVTFCPSSGRMPWCTWSNSYSLYLLIHYWRLDTDISSVCGYQNSAFNTSSGLYGKYYSFHLHSSTFG